MLGRKGRGELTGGSGDVILGGIIGVIGGAPPPVLEAVPGGPCGCTAPPPPPKC